MPASREQQSCTSGLLEVMNTHPREGATRLEKLQPFIRKNQARQVLDLLGND